MINLRRVRKLVESNNDLTLKESIVNKKKQLVIEGKNSSFKLKVNLNESNCDIVILDDENSPIENYEAPMANSQELVNAISNALQLYDVIDEIAPEIKSTEITNSDPVLDAPNKDEEENKEGTEGVEELIVVATEPELEVADPEDVTVVEVPDKEHSEADVEAIEDEELNLEESKEMKTEEQYTTSLSNVISSLRDAYHEVEFLWDNEDDTKKRASYNELADKVKDARDYARKINEVEEDFLGVSDEVRKDSIEKGLVPECLHTEDLEDLEDNEASKFDVPDYLDKAISELEIEKDELDEENKVKLNNVINALKTEKFLIESIIKK